MSGHPGQSSVHSTRIYLQIPGNLPVSHTTGCSHEQLFNQVGFFHPIGSLKGLSAEGALAGQAQETLYPSVVSLPQVGSIFLVGESLR